MMKFYWIIVCLCFCMKGAGIWCQLHFTVSPSASFSCNYDSYITASVLAWPIVRTLHLFTLLPTTCGFLPFDWKALTVVAQLGSGAFGSVYYAKYKGNEKSVVTKKLKSECSDAKSRFVREAKMLLCVIYEYYFAQFKLYLVLTRIF